MWRFSIMGIHPWKSFFRGVKVYNSTCPNNPDPSIQWLFWGPVYKPLRNIASNPFLVGRSFLILKAHWIIILQLPWRSLIYLISKCWCLVFGWVKPPGIHGVTWLFPKDRIHFLVQFGWLLAGCLTLPGNMGPTDWLVSRVWNAAWTRHGSQKENQVAQIVRNQRWFFPCVFPQTL